MSRYGIIRTVRNSLGSQCVERLMKVGLALCTGLTAALVGCSHADQERAREKAIDAKDKTTSAARKLGIEAEAKARELNDKMGAALDGRHPGGTASSRTPKEKLDQATEDAKREGRAAGVKLDHAGMLAKVKAKLANDVGLSTIAKVDVSVDGTVVTLNGTVSSDDQKRQAERSVSTIEGVTRVVNNLAVRP